MAETLIPDLKIVPCIDEQHEMETIGRRVKSLILDQHVSSDRIAVVFENLDSVAETLHAVFTEFGVPHLLRQQRTIAASAVGAFLLRFFEAAQRWEREIVLDVLSSPWSQCAVTAPAAAMAACAAQIVSGYDEWVERLKAFIARLERSGDDDERSVLKRCPGIMETARQLLAQVQKIECVYELLPRRATQRVFAEAVDQVVVELGVEKAVQDIPVPKLPHAKRPH